MKTLVKTLAVAARLRFLAALLIAALLAITAAKSYGEDAAKPPDAEKSAAAEKEAAAKIKNEPNSAARKRRARKSSKPKLAVPDTFPAAPVMAGVNIDEGRAIAHIGSEIRAAVAFRKTLVVWLVELSPAAEALRSSLIEPIVQQMQDFNDAYPDQLEMAVLGYAAEVRWATAKPTSKPSEIQSALTGLSTDKSNSANLCAALRQAIDKYAANRSSESEVLFVIVGASSGDDLKDADAVLLALKRAAIPVFGIGPPARFGQSVAQMVRGRMEREPADEHSPIESLFPERIRLALPGKQGTSDLTDAGYGPFGLERICRQSGGTYVRLHDVSMIGWGLAAADPNTLVFEKYVPDYVNEERYRQLLSENKCRLALHQAAQLPKADGLRSPRMEFDVLSDEAQMARNLTDAQQEAALEEQPIQQLYDAIVGSESDRPKLTGARWQAGYDLAMGQVLSAKARLDGYNAVLATLKQGKKLTNPNSKKWVLEPADEIAVGSALDKMAKNSRVYLERVVKEHQGTPWAIVAERELRYPAGWKLIER